MLNNPVEKKGKFYYRQMKKFQLRKRSDLLSVTPVAVARTGIRSAQFLSLGSFQLWSCKCWYDGSSDHGGKKTSL